MVEVLTPFVGKVRELILAARTYYVRSDGSDSNNGLVDSAGGAFLTIAKALDTVASIDFGPFGCTIQIGNGTWNPPVVPKNYVGAGPLTLRGDPTTPSNVLLSVTGTAINVDAIPNKIVLDGIKIVATGLGLLVNNGSYVELKNMDHGAATIQVYASAVSSVLCQTNYKVSGAASIALYAELAGSITIFKSGGLTVTVTGTPNFSSQYAQATRNGIIIATGITYSGSATGKRYDVLNGGGLVIQGDTLPGNVAGTVASPGWVA